MRHAHYLVPLCPTVASRGYMFVVKIHALAQRPIDGVCHRCQVGSLASLLSQLFVCSLGHWPSSWPQGCKSLPLWLGSWLWAKGFWALTPGQMLHWRPSLGHGVSFCSMFGVASTSGVLACTSLSWPHSLSSEVTTSMEGSQCEKSRVNWFGCCHQLW